MAARTEFNPFSANIHVWETKVGDEEGNGTTVGHTSVELKGGERSRYFSFRPRNSAWVNPLLFFMPTTGKSLSSVNEDTLYEGKQPDRTYQIDLSRNQHQAMAEKTDQLREEAEKASLLYHLFPRLSILKPVQMLATQTGHEELTRCPFSNQKMRDERFKEFEALSKVREGHCASTVHEILNAAEGIDLPSLGSVPWLVTPTQLGNEVSRLTSETH